jgi:hypothetical protein
MSFNIEDKPLGPSEFVSVGKKSYSSPQIFVYGTLRELTLAVGRTGDGDGGSRGSRKKSEFDLWIGLISR